MDVSALCLRPPPAEPRRPLKRPFTVPPRMHGGRWNVSRQSRLLQRLGRRLRPIAEPLRLHWRRRWVALVVVVAVGLVGVVACVYFVPKT